MNPPPSLLTVYRTLIETAGLAPVFEQGQKMTYVEINIVWKCWFTCDLPSGSERAQADTLLYHSAYKIVASQGPEHVNECPVTYAML